GAHSTDWRISLAQGTESLGCHFALSRNRPLSGNADIAIKMAPRDNTLITITPVNIKNRIESFSGAERRFQPRDS
ncbi:hypothetical protein AB8T65_29415, partial [Klebsiella pneumoniae]